LAQAAAYQTLPPFVPIAKTSHLGALE